MSGAGKWIKKHPIETIGLIAGGAFGLPPLMGLLGGAGAAAGAAAVPAVVPAVVGGAEGALGAYEMAMLGESAAGPLAANGLMPGLEPMALIGNQAPQYAALNAGPFNPSAPSFLDKMSKGDLWLADKGMGLLAQNDQPQMPVAPPQGYRGPGPQIPTQGIYDDPELKKRMAMMQQSGRFYG